MLIYYIPTPRKRKRCRQALFPALSAGIVHDEAIDGPSESKKECSPTPLLPRPSELKKEHSLTPLLLGPSELMKEQSPISLLLVKSAGVPHVKAIVGSSKLMNEQSPIPLPLTKLKKKTVRPSTTRPVLAG
jgi:hypothetical protein